MKHFYLLLGLLIVTFSCTTDKSKSYMAFKDIVYINKFPQSISVSNSEKVELDVIGITNISIQDTFLIISTNNREGLWSVFSTNAPHRFIGDFLKIGNGPNEFVFPPSLTRAQFYIENNEVFANIFDSQAGRLFKMNVSTSARNQKLDIKQINDSLLNSIFTVISLEGNNNIYCREITPDQAQQIRYVNKDGERQITKNLTRLNQAAVEMGEDHNILSTIAVKKPDQDVIVEVAVFLNQINIFSVDDTLSKTLCVGKKLNSIEEIQRVGRWNRIYTYGGLRSYPKIWCALYVGETSLDLQLKRKNLPVIQIFDWEGNPLTELKLDRNITSFDIDFQNGYLYTFDSMTEEFYRYNIKDKLQPEWI